MVTSTKLGLFARNRPYQLYRFWIWDFGLRIWLESF